MANNDIEIEIKLPIPPEDFDRIKSNIENKATLVKSSHQIDEYFSPAHRNFVEPQYPFEWLSIRKRGDAAIINYKHWHPENQAVVTHCDEFETNVGDADKLKKIFSALDIESLCKVDKERLVYNFNDEIEIGLDFVEDLGSFIELEAIKDFGSVEAARKRLFAVAEELGCDISEPDLRGYPYLLMKKQGKL